MRREYKCKIIADAYYNCNMHKQLLAHKGAFKTPFIGIKCQHVLAYAIHNLLNINAIHSLQHPNIRWPLQKFAKVRFQHSG